MESFEDGVEGFDDAAAAAVGGGKVSVNQGVECSDQNQQRRARHLMVMVAFLIVYGMFHWLKGFH